MEKLEIPEKGCLECPLYHYGSAEEDGCTSSPRCSLYKDFPYNPFVRLSRCASEHPYGAVITITNKEKEP